MSDKVLIVAPGSGLTAKGRKTLVAAGYQIVEVNELSMIHRLGTAFGPEESEVLRCALIAIARHRGFNDVRQDFNLLLSHARLKALGLNLEAATGVSK